MMKLFRTVQSFAVVTLLLGASMISSPVSAQQASDCGQIAEAAGGNVEFSQRNRGDSRTLLIGLVNAAIDNVQAAVNVLNGAALATNVQVVCITDSLNNNDIDIIRDIDVDVLDEADIDIAVLIGVLQNLFVDVDDVNILAVVIEENKIVTVYVAPANFTFN
jgi:hypothetical protein